MIETNRLVLRQFSASDAEDVFEYLKEPSVNCFKCMKKDTVKQTERMLEERSGNPLCLAVVLKSNCKVIGEVEAHGEKTNPEEQDSPADTFGMCWMLNDRYRSKGYAFEAVSAFFDYLFCQMGARRIYAFTEDYNLPSQKLCERLGMRREGEFVEYVSFVSNDEGPIYENTLQYAVLKREWQKNRIQ